MQSPTKQNQVYESVCVSWRGGGGGGGGTGIFPLSVRVPPKKFKNYDVIIASTANRVLNVSRIFKYLAGIPMCILTCVCTFAHIYITTPQEKSRVKPWCV